MLNLAGKPLNADDLNLTGFSTMSRASVSFPRESYRMLEEIAIRKKVSIAWVVREAVENYLQEQFPLFGSSISKGGV